MKSLDGSLQLAFLLSWQKALSVTNPMNYLVSLNVVQTVVIVTETFAW